MKKVFIVVSILIVAGLIQAQSVPDFVNYQGRLTDEGGAPLATGDYALRFEVYNDPVAGSRVWGPLCFDRNPPAGLDPGHKYVVPVVQGYFNVVLDQDTGVTDCTEPPDGGDPAPVSTAFTAGLRYVEVAVWNETGLVWEPILPRQHVLSAPYAVSADRSREVVSAEGQPTRIACKTGPATEVDVITVSDAGVGVEGDLGVTGAVGITGSLDVTENLTVGGSVTAGGFLGGTVARGYCWKTDYLNDFDAPIDYSCIRVCSNSSGPTPTACAIDDDCSPGVCQDTVMTGIDSYHNNSREDRRWRVYCCTLVTQ